MDAFVVRDLGHEPEAGRFDEAVPGGVTAKAGKCIVMLPVICRFGESRSVVVGFFYAFWVN